MPPPHSVQSGQGLRWREAKGPDVGHGMLPKDNRQTMMFSATFPESCQKRAQDFLYAYIWIGVGIVGGAVDTVEQQLVRVKPHEKYEMLFGVLDNFFATRVEKERCLVFVNAKDTAKWLDEQLYEKKIDTSVDGMTSTSLWSGLAAARASTLASTTPCRWTSLATRRT